jgi:hypothetical protein
LELVYASQNPATARFLCKYRQPLMRESRFSNDFGNYPVIYWASHCQLAPGRRMEGALKDLFLFFLSNESDPASAFTLWTDRVQGLYPIDLKLYTKLKDTKAVSATALFLACSFDFPEVIADQFTREIFQADYTNSNGLTALQVAVNMVVVV